MRNSSHTPACSASVDDDLETFERDALARDDEGSPDQDDPDRADEDEDVRQNDFLPEGPILGRSDEHACNRVWRMFARNGFSARGAST